MKEARRHPNRELRTRSNPRARTPLDPRALDIRARLPVVRMLDQGGCCAKFSRLDPWIDTGANCLAGNLAKSNQIVSGSQASSGPAGLFEGCGGTARRLSSIQGLCRPQQAHIGGRTLPFGIRLSATKEVCRSEDWEVHASEFGSAIARLYHHARNSARAPPRCLKDCPSDNARNLGNFARGNVGPIL